MCCSDVLLKACLTGEVASTAMNEISRPKYSRLNLARKADLSLSAYKILALLVNGPDMNIEVAFFPE